MIAITRRGTTTNGAIVASRPARPFRAATGVLPESRSVCPVGRVSASSLSVRSEERAANRFQPTRIRSPRRKPIWKTIQVIRITPPMRATPANGPATWAMPIDASGTPPNGNEKRSASTSVCAVGRAMICQRPAGTASAAQAWNPP